MKKTLFLVLIPIISFSQTLQDLQKIGNLLQDALFYSEKFVQPATDAAIYQASSSWMISPKKKENWKLNIGLHGNFFVVPNSDRTFQIKNSDFKFLQIENNTELTVPSAIGNDEEYFLVGSFSNSQVRLKTPKGINSEVVIYPFLQANFSLPYGFELVGRYSFKTKLKKADYQVFGFGLQHNLNQYFSERADWHYALQLNYSKENFNIDFIDVNTQFGNLGLNNLLIDIDSYQSQIGVSKSFEKVEFLGNLIFNRSFFNYKVNGPKGSIEEVIPTQDTINELLNTIEYPKNNFIGEIGCNYNFLDNFLFTSKIAFGKFANFNFGVNYLMN